MEFCENIIFLNWNFAEKNYKSVIEINFVLQKQYKDIFDDGFEVDTIIKNISLINPDLEFPKGETDRRDVSKNAIRLSIITGRI